MTMTSTPSTKTFCISEPVTIWISCWSESKKESASLKLSIGPSKERSSWSSERARSKSLLVQASKKPSATCSASAIKPPPDRLRDWRRRDYARHGSVRMAQHPRSLSKSPGQPSSQRACAQRALGSRPALTQNPQTVMKLQNDFTDPDPISETLVGIRIRSTLYCRSLMRAPWGFGVEAHGNPAFHIVVEGQAWLEIEGEPDQIHLSAGGLVGLATGKRPLGRGDSEASANQPGGELGAGAA